MLFRGLIEPCHCLQFHSMLGSSHLLDVQVKGVAESFKKHETDKTDSKGIKAYFTLDEAGILALEKVRNTYTVAP